MKPDGTTGRASRLHHVAFGLALLLLAAVGVWWVVFLARTTRALDLAWRESAGLRAEVLAHDLSHQPLPEEGPVMGHADFAVSASQAGALIPGTSLSVVLTDAALARQDAALSRRRLMIFGEGALLLGLVGACVQMLYRLTLAERRYRLDTEGFVRRVTHEMKTPLAGIKALLLTLHDGRVPADRLQETAQLGLRQAERQEHLIENLLTAHRLTIGSAVPHLEVVALQQELQAFITHRERSMGPTQSPVLGEVPEDLAALAARAGLATILDNLADNAFKYGATRAVLSASTASDGSPVVTLSDDGSGFAPGAAESLFGVFHRGRPPAGTASTHGTGLGLAISRALAREMGGDLVGASAGEGRGASFTVRLRRPEGAA